MLIGSERPDFRLFQISLQWGDKDCVSRFLENAGRIFEAAADAARCGLPASDLAILIHREGGIQVIMDGGWSVPGLLAHSGASMAYRVSHHPGGVRVEGRCGPDSCLFEGGEPAAVARRLLAPDPICCASQIVSDTMPLLCPPQNL